MPHDLLAGKNDEVGLASTGCRTRIRTLTKGSKVPCATVTPSGTGASILASAGAQQQPLCHVASKSECAAGSLVPKAGVEPARGLPLNGF